MRFEIFIMVIKVSNDGQSSKIFQRTEDGNVKLCAVMVDTRLSQFFKTVLLFGFQKITYL
jgi:hypothetical protein